MVSASVLSCANSQTVCRKKKDMPKEEITIGTSKAYTQVFNKDKTLALYYKITQEPSDPATIIDYYVEEVASRKIIRKEIYRGTSVEWGEGRNLVLTPYVGMIRKESYEVLIDEKNAENTKKSNQIIIKL